MTELSHIHRWEPGTDQLTVLALHGTGGDENDLLPLVKMLHPTANVLSPRGKVLEGGMPRFFRRIAMGVFDIEDLKARAQDLLTFVDEAADEYGFHREKVVVAGYSNGANIAGGMLFMSPGAFAGAALFHAMKPFDPEGAIDLAETPVFLSGGRMDPIIPAPQTEALGALLTSAGANLTMFWGPGGHELTNPEVEAARKWFSTFFVS
jgi:phospholipase/carboxylesterase